MLYFLFFFPGMLAFVYAGYGYAELSWMMNEHSSASPFGPPVYHFKSLIPIVGVLMVMQGIVEVIRCIMCIRTGEWPKRLHDVEELDKIMLEKAEHGEYQVVEGARGDRAAQGRHLMFGIGNPELGVIMLGMFVVFIMFGFPIAFTLMALGVFFGYFAMGDLIFNLLVQRTYSVMTNDVLISIPLFVFMGYIIERANILDRLFRSLQLAAGPVPASLALATLATCAIFATATGIVGACVTLMGLLAFPAMLRAGYDVKIAAGRGLRRRLPRHSHPAERHAHSLRRDRRRFGGQALRRRLLSRHHAGRTLHALRHHHDAAQSEAGAEAAGGRAQRARRDRALGAGDVVRCRWPG